VRKWLPVFPIVLAITLTAFVFNDLPAVVYPDWGQVLPFDAPPEGMARMGFALLLPVVALALWAVLVAIARVRGAKAGIVPEHLAASAVERFEPTFHIVVLAVVSLIALFHLALLAAAVGWPAWTVKAVGAALGVGLLLVGNLMPRVRPNWIVGIRTRATLADPALWMRTHRYFGGFLMISGVAVLVIAFVAVRFAFVSLIAGFIISAVAAHALAAPESRR
jgi:hypothetical protein